MHRIFFNGLWREIKRRYVFHAGSWRAVKRAWVYTGGAWRQYYVGVDPFTITFEPSSLFASSFSNRTVTGSVSTIVSGGLAPFTYSWTVVSFTAPVSPLVASPTLAATNLTQTGVQPDSFEDAVFRVSVTDTVGQTGTADLPASFFNNASL
jgi:hypothetical protein